MTSSVSRMLARRSNRAEPIALLTTVALGLLLVASSASAQSHPQCQSSSADADGDGWGWENNASCMVASSPKPTVNSPSVSSQQPAAWLPACQSDSSDPDGDGYGFENGQSCSTATTGSAQQSNRSSNSASNNSASSLPACQSNRTDPDGDGFGFENGRSCSTVNLVASNNESSQRAQVNQSGSQMPNCQAVNSDADGDGFGWENNHSCIVVAGPQSQVTEIKIPTVSAARAGVASVDDITDVVLVTGQSNVLASNTAYDSNLDAPGNGVFAYTDSGWQIADLHQTWDRFLHPGNQSLNNPNKQPTNSFALHFGKTLVARDPGRVVAFIVVPGPGKGISNWDKGTTQYERITQKVTQALAGIAHKHSVDAVLWHQGENDWLYEGTADANPTGFTSKDSFQYKNYYQIKLNALIANFRNESWGRGDTAFICGETRRAEGVNRRLMALNSDDDHRTACVPATDLPKRADDPYGSHFSAQGLRTLGQRYADMYFNMN